MEGIEILDLSTLEQMNITDYDLGTLYDPTGDSELGTLEYLYVLPVIITVGLIGNVISLITIFNSRLRYMPANQYLIVMTSADSLFLFGVVLILLKVDYSNYISCVIVEYILMSSSYVSAWATAALTIERYIALVYPLLNVRLASESRVVWMLVWVPVPFIIHLLQFINLEPSDPPERSCTPRVGNYQIFVELGDSLLCYVLPCACVVILNALVSFRMARAKRAFSGESRAVNRAGAGPARDSKRSGGSTQSGNLAILWVVPMVFVLLNTPFYIVKLTEMFERIFVGTNSSEYSHFRILVHNVAHYLYYLNFSCDVIVYAFSSAHFRKTVVMSWKNILRMEKKRKPKYTTIELTKIPRTKSADVLGSLDRNGTNRDTCRTVNTDILDDSYSSALLPARV